MTDAVNRARELVDETPGAHMLDQFTNTANPEMHRQTTAVEIWEDTLGAVDVFVSAVGTGGTITGVGEALKERKPSVQLVAVEPAGACGKPPDPRHRCRVRSRCLESLNSR
jgi:cysteine synthase